ncbi:MAG: hypothetical protein EA378_11255 [Phycisphaerales bacterium]|nr:MAG: hypothetical protein EA378_11255 [Phycisphaerales bacterium]
MAESGEKASRKGLLDAIEWAGNKLPDPAVLFLFGAILVMVVSHLVAPSYDEDGNVVGGWVVQPKVPVEVIDPATGEQVLQLVAKGEPEVARSLLTVDGLYWCLESMVDNFMNFPPLGVVLVGILGIGVAERTGLIAALLKTFMLAVPRNLLTPTMVFLGIMSSVGSDAGYVVLPPLAAAIYLAAGRSPLAGIAAVFAGVSAGFNANLLITTLEPIMAEFTAQGAQIVDPERRVAPTASWYFMAVSTFVVTGTGWLTSALFVEKRLMAKLPADGGPDLTQMEPEGPSPWRGDVLGFLFASLVAAALGVVLLAIGLSGEAPEGTGVRVVPMLGMLSLLASGIVLFPLFVRALARIELERRETTGIFWSMVGLTGMPVLVALLVLLPSIAPGWVEETPLSGMDGVFQRWVAVIVPLIFIIFIIPGLIYGIIIGVVKDSKDATKFMIQSIEGMAPIIVLAFFAAQFIEYFTYSNLGRMLAFSGGEWLFEQQMDVWMLIVAFIALTMVFNLFVGSMSAKYALFAPIFVPMFMLIGLRPELTMVAYRIGDSVTNIVTPLNSYLVIILVFMQRFAPKAGMGTLIAMMLPYSVVFAIVWTIFLLLWMQTGLPLGPGDPNQVFAPALE